jgi:hypothetical protein
VVADFLREYAIDVDALAWLPSRRFFWLLQGLSDKSRFRTAWVNQPKHVHDPDERAAIHAAARR